MAVGQNHFGIVAPPISVHASGDWNVHWEYGVLTHGHMHIHMVHYASARFRSFNKPMAASSSCLAASFSRGSSTGKGTSPIDPSQRGGRIWLVLDLLGRETRKTPMATWGCLECSDQPEGVSKPFLVWGNKKNVFPLAQQGKPKVAEQPAISRGPMLRNVCNKGNQKLESNLPFQKRGCVLLAGWELMTWPKDWCLIFRLSKPQAISAPAPADGDVVIPGTLEQPTRIQILWCSFQPTQHAPSTSRLSAVNQGMAPIAHPLWLPLSEFVSGSFPSRLVALPIRHRQGFRPFCFDAGLWALRIPARWHSRRSSGRKTWRPSPLPSAG